MSRLGDSGGSAAGGGGDRPLPARTLAGYCDLQCQVVRACATGLAEAADAGGPGAEVVYRALLDLAQRLREIGEARLGEIRE